VVHPDPAASDPDDVPFEKILLERCRAAFKRASEGERDGGKDICGEDERRWPSGACPECFREAAACGCGSDAEAPDKYVSMEERIRNRGIKPARAVRLMRLLKEVFLNVGVAETVNMFITTTCPLKCRFCIAANLNRKEQDVPLELLKRIIDQFEGISGMRFGGSGEPFCYGGWRFIGGVFEPSPEFWDILSYAAARVGVLYIDTNGIAIPEDDASARAFFARLPGNAVISLSIDEYHREELWKRFYKDQRRIVEVLESSADVVSCQYNVRYHMNEERKDVLSEYGLYEAYNENRRPMNVYHIVRQGAAAQNGKESETKDLSVSDIVGHILHPRDYDLYVSEGMLVTNPHVAFMSPKPGSAVMGDVSRESVVDILLRSVFGRHVDFRAEAGLRQEIESYLDSGVPEPDMFLAERLRDAWHRVTEEEYFALAEDISEAARRQKMQVDLDIRPGQEVKKEQLGDTAYDMDQCSFLRMYYGDTLARMLAFSPGEKMPVSGLTERVKKLIGRGTVSSFAIRHVLLKLGDAYAQRHDGEMSRAALACYDALLAVIPGARDEAKKEVVGILHKKVNLYYSLYKFHAMAEHAGMIITLVPSDAPAWAAKGRALRALGDRVKCGAMTYFELADQAFTEAVRLNPGCFAAWNEKMRIYYYDLAKFRGFYPNAGIEALSCCDKVIELDTSRSLGNAEDAWSIKGSVFEEAGRYEEAIACYEECIGMNEDYFLHWEKMFNVLKKTGRQEDVLRCYDEYGKACKDFRDESCLEKADYLTLLGRYREAVGIYTSLIEKKGTVDYVASFAVERRAYAYMRWGKYSVILKKEFERNKFYRLYEVLSAAQRAFADDPSGVRAEGMREMFDFILDITNEALRNRAIGTVLSDIKRRLGLGQKNASARAKRRYGLMSAGVLAESLIAHGYEEREFKGWLEKVLAEESIPDTKETGVICAYVRGELDAAALLYPLRPGESRTDGGIINKILIDFLVGGDVLFTGLSIRIQNPKRRMFIENIINKTGYTILGWLLGVDIRPVRFGLLDPLYVAYDMAVKNVVNPFNQEKSALYKAAGADVSAFLLSTNAANADFESFYYGLSRSDLEKLKVFDKVFTSPEEKIFIIELKLLKFFDGYTPSPLLDWTDSDFYKLFSCNDKIIMNLGVELRSLGVDLSNIRVDSDFRGYPRITFHWTYHNANLREYSITFLDAWNKEPIYKEYDIYYQKAAMDVTFAYKMSDKRPNFIQRVHVMLNPEGCFITDDRGAVKEGETYVYSDLSRYFPLSLDEMPVIISRSIGEGIIRKRKKNPSDFTDEWLRYGWNLKVRRRSDVDGGIIRGDRNDAEARFTNEDEGVYASIQKILTGLDGRNASHLAETLEIPAQTIQAVKITREILGDIWEVDFRDELENMLKLLPIAQETPDDVLPENENAELIAEVNVIFNDFFGTRGKMYLLPENILIADDARMRSEINALGCGCKLLQKIVIARSYWLNKDMQIIIHETLHLNFEGILWGYLNEALTEWLTRRVTASRGIKIDSSIYLLNILTCGPILAHISKETLINAYIFGRLDLIARETGADKLRFFADFIEMCFARGEAMLTAYAGDFLSGEWVTKGTVEEAYQNIKQRHEKLRDEEIQLIMKGCDIKKDGGITGDSSLGMARINGVGYSAAIGLELILAGIYMRTGPPIILKTPHYLSPMYYGLSYSAVVSHVFNNSGILLAINPSSMGAFSIRGWRIGIPMEAADYIVDGPGFAPRVFYRTVAGWGQPFRGASGAVLLQETSIEGVPAVLAAYVADADLQGSIPGDGGEINMKDYDPARTIFVSDEQEKKHSTLNFKALIPDIFTQRGAVEATVLGACAYGKLDPATALFNGHFSFMKINGGPGARIYLGKAFWNKNGKERETADDLRFALFIAQKAIPEDCFTKQNPLSQEFQGLQLLHGSNPEHVMDVFAEGAADVKVDGVNYKVPFYTGEFLEGFYPIMPVMSDYGGSLIMSENSYEPYMKIIVRMITENYFELGLYAIADFNIGLGDVLFSGEKCKLAACRGGLVRKESADFMHSLVFNSGLVSSAYDEAVQRSHRAIIVEEVFSVAREHGYEAEIRAWQEKEKEMLTAGFNGTFDGGTLPGAAFDLESPERTYVITFAQKVRLFKLYPDLFAVDGPRSGKSYGGYFNYWIPNELLPAIRFDKKLAYVIVEDYERLSETITRIAGDLIRKKPEAVMLIPGCNTPLGFYRKLAEQAARKEIDISRVRFVTLARGFIEENLRGEHNFIDYAVMLLGFMRFWIIGVYNSGEAYIWHREALALSEIPVAVLESPSQIIPVNFIENQNVLLQVGKRNIFGDDGSQYVFIFKLNRFEFNRETMGLEETAFLESNFYCPMRYVPAFNEFMRSIPKNRAYSVLRKAQCRPPYVSAITIAAQKNNKESIRSIAENRSEALYYLVRNTLSPDVSGRDMYRMMKERTFDGGYDKEYPDAFLIERIVSFVEGVEVTDRITDEIYVLWTRVEGAQRKLSIHLERKRDGARDKEHYAVQCARKGDAVSILFQKEEFNFTAEGEVVNLAGHKVIRQIVSVVAAALPVNTQVVLEWVTNKATLRYLSQNCLPVKNEGVVIRWSGVSVVDKLTGNSDTEVLLEETLRKTLLGKVLVHAGLSGLILKSNGKEGVGALNMLLQDSMDGLIPPFTLAAWKRDGGLQRIYKQVFEGFERRVIAASFRNVAAAASLIFAALSFVINAYSAPAYAALSYWLAPLAAQAEGRREPASA
jgi:tetratricopeptide (TPR) repeat protein